MLRLAGALLAFTLTLTHVAISAAATGGRPTPRYISPVPSARLVRPETNIIIRPGGIVDDLAGRERGLITVRGSSSGEHTGITAVSEDRRTITFTPDAPFEPGEAVSWRLAAGLPAGGRWSLPAMEFEFTIGNAVRGSPRFEFDALEGPAVGGPMLSPLPPWLWRGHEDVEAGSAADSLPADFPVLTRTVYGTPSPGRLFLCSIVLGDPTYRSTLIIANDDGTPLFHRQLPGRGLDFKVQPDGRLTYFDTISECYYAMNANYATVDSFRCGNGYPTDLHELQTLPNGHALLMSYDRQKVDMSLVVPGGNPDATVVGLIIQELDRGKQVIFQWRSWDHFQWTIRWDSRTSTTYAACRTATSRCSTTASSISQQPRVRSSTASTSRR